MPGPKTTCASPYDVCATPSLTVFTSVVTSGNSAWRNAANAAIRSSSCPLVTRFTIRSSVWAGVRRPRMRRKPVCSRACHGCHPFALAKLRTPFTSAALHSLWR